LFQILKETKKTPAHTNTQNIHSKKKAHNTQHATRNITQHTINKHSHNTAWHDTNTNTKHKHAMKRQSAPCSHLLDFFFMFDQQQKKI